MTTRTGGDAHLRAAVDPAVIEAALAELDGKSPEQLATEAKALEDTLSSVFKAAGKELDLKAEALDAIEGFGGEGVGARATKITDMHSRLAAVEHLRHKHARVRAIAEEVDELREAALRGAYDTADRGDRGTQAMRRQTTDAFLAAVRDAHGVTATVREAYLASPGELFRMRIEGSEADAPLKRFLAAVVTTDAGWDPFVIRQPGHTPAISRPLQVYQTMPMSMTDQHSIKYMVQNRRDASDIVEKAEGAQSGEADMTWVERTEDMREIPGHIPVTEVQLEDEPQVRAIIEADLRQMLMQRLDGQLVNGTGVAPLLGGVRVQRGGQDALAYRWSREGAAGTARNDQLDDLKKAKTALILQGRVMPDRYYLHHEIWDEVSLAETTALGYYLGNPADYFQERIWGLPVTLTDHLSAALTANAFGGWLQDSMYLRLWIRRTLHVEVGLIDKQFIERTLTIRAGIRVCLQIRRPQAVQALLMPA